MLLYRLVMVGAIRGRMKHRKLINIAFGLDHEHSRADRMYRATV